MTPKRMLFRKMMGKRGNVKSSFLFWTLLALAWATAIVSMTYSYDVSDRHLSGYADESEFRYKLTEESNSSTGNQRNDVEVKLGTKAKEGEEIADADDTIQIKECALLFFGSLGEGFETLSLPSIQRNIIQTNPKCDIFLHTYADTEKQWKKAKLLTDNNLYVYVEEMDSFQEKSRSFLESAGKYYNRSPEEHEKMIQEWHSIQKVWGLMKNTEDGKQARKYAQVALFQSNIYYASPIDISHSTAALPNHSHYGGYNKRMFYGSRHNAKVWSFRFRFADRFEKTYMLKISEENSGAENRHIGYHTLALCLEP